MCQGQGSGPADGRRLSLRLLAHGSYRRRPWRNGQGTSCDIAAGDGWQLSVADIVRSGGFSDFAGSLRLFAVVAGAVVLHLPGGRSIACDPASPVAAFDGGKPPDCEVVRGPARALNLIARAGKVEPGLVRLAPGPSFEPVGGRPGGEVAAVFVQSGRIECQLRRGPVAKLRQSDATLLPRVPGEGPVEAGEDPAAGMLADTADSVIVTGPVPREDFLLRAVAGRPVVVLVASIRLAGPVPARLPDVRGDGEQPGYR